MSTVLITGANRGIGLELTKRYVEAGHRVLACCRAPVEAVILQEMAGSHELLTVHGVLVAEASSVTALGAELGTQPIDLLINNAGMNAPFDQQSLLQMDYEAWMEMFAVNAMAPLRMLQQLLPNLEASAAEPPKVITISSQMGSLALDMPVGYAYSSSKAAVNKVMKMAASELVKQGIAVALIHPGWVQTDMGGPRAAITVGQSAEGVMGVIDALTLDDTGCFRTWEGEEHPW